MIFALLRRSTRRGIVNGLSGKKASPVFGFIGIGPECKLPTNVAFALRADHRGVFFRRHGIDFGLGLGEQLYQFGIHAEHLTTNRSVEASKDRAQSAAVP